LRKCRELHFDYLVVSCSFGSLWIGTAAGFFGEQTAVIMSAALAFLGAVAIWKLFPALRTTE